jgi:hypothetical protein
LSALPLLLSGFLMNISTFQSINDVAAIRDLNQSHSILDVNVIVVNNNLNGLCHFFFLFSYLTEI